jgi:hypothetical protein
MVGRKRHVSMVKLDESPKGVKYAIHFLPLRIKRRVLARLEIASTFMLTFADGFLIRCFRNHEVEIGVRKGEF